MIEISHVFKYEGYTGKQRFIQWGLYMLRFISDIISGLVGLLSLGTIMIYWSGSISERILRNQIKFYKEKRNEIQN